LVKLEIVGSHMAAFGLGVRIELNFKLEAYRSWCGCCVVFVGKFLTQCCSAVYIWQYRNGSQKSGHCLGLFYRLSMGRKNETIYNSSTANLPSSGWTSHCGWD
jgi:hypothetical protein